MKDLRVCKEERLKMRVCSKTQEMLLEFAVWTGILSCVLANILKNQNKKMGKANNVTFVFIRILTSSWQRWKLLLMSRWSVLYMATSSMSAASTTLNNWTPAFFFFFFCLCACVCVYYPANMHAVMLKICMMGASGLKCVCPSDSRMIKLLHSNELWLSVWQLLF